MVASLMCDNKYIRKRCIICCFYSSVAMRGGEGITAWVMVLGILDFSSVGGIFFFQFLFILSQLTENNFSI